MSVNILLFLVVNTSAIDCLERLLQNDLLCVDWDVKPYTIIHSLIFAAAGIYML